MQQALLFVGLVILTLITFDFLVMAEHFIGRVFR